MSASNHLEEHIALKIHNLPPINSARPKLVITGDSWAAAEEAATATNSSAKGIMHNLNMRLGHYFEIVAMVGAGGERLDEIAARYATDALSVDADFIAIIGGLNDIAQHVAQSRTAALMFADTNGMIDATVAQGKIPIVFPCQLAYGGYDHTDAGTEQNSVDIATAYNRLLAEYATQKAGWIYASKAWDGITDQEYTTGLGNYVPAIAAGYFTAPDEGHINGVGGFRVAKDLYDQIGHLFQTPDGMPRHDNDYGSACHNPMQKASGTPHAGGVTGGTGITGTPPEGWYARVRNAGTGACTVSQVARTDVAGAYWSRCVCTNMQSGQNIELRESDTTAFNYDYHLLADHDLAVGDVVEITVEVKVHSISGTVVTTGELNGFNMSIQFVDGANAGVSTIIANANGGSTDAVLNGDDMADEVLIISTVPYTIPATTAKWYIYLQSFIQSGATGDTDFTFDVGRIGIRKVG